MRTEGMYERGSGRERGSAGMVEMVLTIPILLFIAGATFDITRKVAYLQTTSFVSSEAAAQIYRQCSDLTVYDYPNPIGTRPNCPNDSQGNQPLCVKTANLDGSITGSATESVVQSCMARVLQKFTSPLNASAPTAFGIIGTVYRVNLRDPNTSTACSNNNFSVSSLLETTSAGSMTNNPYEGLAIPGGLSATLIAHIVLSARTLAYTAGTGVTQVQLVTNSTRLIIPEAEMCSRGRLVSVEVSYIFDPIVKFLPRIIIADEYGFASREATIF